MYILIFHLGQIPQKRRRSYISFLIPITFYLPIIDSDQHIDSDIKFPPVVEKRIGNILLDNEGTGFAIFLTGFSALDDSLPDVLEFTCTSYALASIGELAGFHDPHIWELLFTALYES